MTSKLLFKVWDVSRTKKTFLAVNDGPNIYDNLILKASEKLQLNGSKLILESDGTEVDEEVLILLKDETFLLLEPHELWAPPQPPLKTTNTPSLCDTLTNSFTSIENEADQISTSIDNNNTGEQSKSIDNDNTGEQSVFENNWLSFKIPWFKMTASSLKNCESGKRDRHSYTHIVQTVADEMQDFAINKDAIPNKAIRIVAHKIVAKYPKMFTDMDDDGTVLGDDGAIILFHKLKDRLKYLSRAGKRNIEGQDPPVPLKKRKKILSSQAGCSNWFPEETSEDEDVDTSKALLKTMELNDEGVINALEKTYANQRQFLNNSEKIPTVEDIKNEYPVLLTAKGICWHFQKLVQKEITTLGDNMLQKFGKFCSLGRKKKYLNDEDMVRETEEKKLFLIIDVTCRFFNENAKIIYSQIGDREAVKDCQHNTPYVVSLQSEGKVEYFVVFERVILNEAISFKSALEQVFALYFNFNLEYPGECANTFEFWQRYYLKIYPEQGTKNKKPKKSQLSIISLINKLRDC